MYTPTLSSHAKLLAAILLSMQLAACVPVVAGGAVAGGVMAADRRTGGIYIEDQAIELKAKKMIVDNIGAANINVSVTSFNLNVLLTGEAISEEVRAKAERAALSVENVKTVTNELAISEKSDLGTSANDTYITSKVKTNMLKENRFPANYVKVVTENSVVYLMGMVTRQEGEDAVDIARNVDGVAKVVKVFEYID
ncbi:MAG: transporter [Betaproteobacteria bacterium HGW-Betaproteobacteria-8]|nr:MAG: transporter [Betaproteobacteria bacterium HGW-Betaproteobacteria-8]